MTFERSGWGVRTATKAVNAELVTLYWQLGAYISRKIASAEWGDSVVDSEYAGHPGRVYQPTPAAWSNGFTPGAAQYALLPNETGGAVDDIIVYRRPEGEDGYLVVVNASNREKDLEHLRRHAPAFGVTLRDRSDEFALLALQGPKAEAILSRIAEGPLAGLGYYRFVETAGLLAERRETEPLVQ